MARLTRSPVFAACLTRRRPRALLPEEAIVNILAALRSLNPDTEVYTRPRCGDDPMRVAGRERSLRHNALRVTIGIRERKLEDRRRTLPRGQPEDGPVPLQILIELGKEIDDKTRFAGDLPWCSPGQPVGRGRIKQVRLGGIPWELLAHVVTHPDQSEPVTGARNERQMIALGRAVDTRHSDGGIPGSALRSFDRDIQVARGIRRWPAALADEVDQQRSVCRSSE